MWKEGTPLTCVYRDLWEQFLRTSGEPNIPTLEDAAKQTLSQSEAEQFVAYLRPRVEAGEGMEREAVAYLWAVKS